MKQKQQQRTANLEPRSKTTEREEGGEKEKEQEEQEEGLRLVTHSEPAHRMAHPVARALLAEQRRPLDLRALLRSLGVRSQHPHT